MISNHAPSAARTTLHVLHTVFSMRLIGIVGIDTQCVMYGRGDRIRTCDLLVPNQARYQTALRPVT